MEEIKIDRRIKYILMLDTETANGFAIDGKMDLRDSLFYDIGFAVIDKLGRVYEAESYVNTDIFLYEKEMMKSAYYAEKIPMYYKGLWEGSRCPNTTYGIKCRIAELIDRYNIEAVCAHNARFDVNALNTTQRYRSKSKYRYFLPKNVEIWDTLKMARQVVAPTPTYRKFCEDNDYLTKNGQVRLTAEILYRFITGNNNFIEAHTGLEDVMIEKEILAYCFRKKKKMDKVLYGKG